MAKKKKEKKSLLCLVRDGLLGIRYATLLCLTRAYVSDLHISE